MNADPSGMLFNSVTGEIFACGCEPVYGSIWYDDYYSFIEKKAIESCLSGKVSLLALYFNADYHYYRNSYNDLPSVATIMAEWVRQPDSKNVFHQNVIGEQGFDATYNVKYLSPDGKREAVICLALGNIPYIVNDPINMGTYNYGTASGWDHFWKDILPYWLHGNSREDTNLNRLTGRSRKGITYVPNLS